MTPIPGEPLDPKPPELTTSDGRKVKLRIPGLAPPPKPVVVVFICPGTAFAKLLGGVNDVPVGNIAG